MDAKRYAVVRMWNDNESDFQVLEYFNTIKDGEDYISQQNKSELYDYEVMKYT